MVAPLMMKNNDALDIFIAVKAVPSTSATSASRKPPLDGTGATQARTSPFQVGLFLLLLLLDGTVAHRRVA